ncbi:DUF6876 family protein [Flagellimonas nanhaiensis]|uniref:DUF6876 domain-containing protein n=1 Tax=Flagellimonas nanhaiensis TaxID=2292706 RepID=A0A371JLU4_9FLAO|nr:DUF6876 family protein [Allomuricauda nanhaiensis]RDY57936.1 hypothetical protein DX873_17475 [Allomuricauda nanhaiensis]
METIGNITENLQHFHGSEVLYRIPLIRTQYTEGIQYLAEAADCFWLVTDTSVIARSLMGKSRFITVDFKKHDEKEKEKMGYAASITYTDGNGQIFETQGYHLTDFPLEKLRLFFVNGTLMLPSEY